MLAPFLLPHRLEAGCDEAGRGCLAGSVFAAAVILPADFDCPMLNDSKKLTANQREILRPIIEQNAIAYAVATATAAEIDDINILNASFLAMHRAIAALAVMPDYLLIDGNRFRQMDGFAVFPYTTIIKGDGKMMSIAAASVLAKTYRDAYMLNLHAQYPDYAWASNQGYPTIAHRRAIATHGLTAEHRQTFRWQLTEI
jgi:ribonuclease HII